MSASVQNLRQIRHGTGAFDKFLEGSHDRGASEEFAEEVDLAAKLVVRNRLDELFCGSASYGVVLGDLRSRRAGDSKGLALTSKLRHQADGLRASCVNRSSGEKQIPHKSISKIAFQARDPAEARNEAEAQLGKSKTRHFIGDDHVAGQRQFESSAKTSTMNGGDGDKGRGIDRVQNRVDAFEKGAYARGAVFCGSCRRSRIQLAQISTRGKEGLARAGNNAGGRLRSEHVKLGNKLFQFGEHGGANFVGRRMIESQLDHAFAPFPTQRFTGESFHACCLLAASRVPFESYMALISEAYRALMASRRSLPLAVSKLSSEEKTSRTIV